MWHALTLTIMNKTRQSKRGNNLEYINFGFIWNKDNCSLWYVWLFFSNFKAFFCVCVCVWCKRHGISHIQKRSVHSSHSIMVAFCPPEIWPQNWYSKGITAENLPQTFPDFLNTWWCLTIWSSPAGRTVLSYPIGSCVGQITLNAITQYL